MSLSVLSSFIIIVVVVVVVIIVIVILVFVADQCSHSLRRIPVTHYVQREITQRNVSSLTRRDSGSNVT